jgi:hypothetical protein
MFANTLLKKIKKKKIQYSGRYGTSREFTGLWWLKKKADHSETTSFTAEEFHFKEFYEWCNKQKETLILTHLITLNCKRHNKLFTKSAVTTTHYVSLSLQES